MSGLGSAISAIGYGLGGYAKGRNEYDEAELKKAKDKRDEELQAENVRLANERLGLLKSEEARQASELGMRQSELGMRQSEHGLKMKDLGLRIRDKEAQLGAWAAQDEALKGGLSFMSGTGAGDGDAMTFLNDQAQRYRSLKPYVDQAVASRNPQAARHQAELENIKTQALSQYSRAFPGDLSTLRSGDADGARAVSRAYAQYMTNGLSAFDGYMDPGTAVKLADQLGEWQKEGVTETANYLHSGDLEAANKAWARGKRRGTFSDIRDDVFEINGQRIPTKSAVLTDEKGNARRVNALEYMFREESPKAMLQAAMKGEKKDRLMDLATEQAKINKDQNAAAAGMGLSAPRLETNIQTILAELQRRAPAGGAGVGVGAHADADAALLEALRKRREATSKGSQPASAPVQAPSSRTVTRVPLSLDTVSPSLRDAGLRLFVGQGDKYQDTKRLLPQNGALMRNPSLLYLDEVEPSRWTGGFSPLPPTTRGR